MKKTFLVMLAVLCACLFFVSCSAEKEELKPAELEIIVANYSTKAKFDEQIPNGITYKWSDNNGGKSEEDLKYSGESDRIIIYPTKGSTSVAFECSWKDAKGNEQSSKIPSIAVSSVDGAKATTLLNLGLTK